MRSLRSIHSNDNNDANDNKKNNQKKTKPAREEGKSMVVRPTEDNTLKTRASVSASAVSVKVPDAETTVGPVIDIAKTSGGGGGGGGGVGTKQLPLQQSQHTIHKQKTQSRLTNTAEPSLANNPSQNQPIMTSKSRLTKNSHMEQHIQQTKSNIHLKEHRHEKIPPAKQMSFVPSYVQKQARTVLHNLKTDEQMHQHKESRNKPRAVPSASKQKTDDGIAQQLQSSDTPWTNDLALNPEKHNSTRHARSEPGGLHTLSTKPQPIVETMKLPPPHILPISNPRETSLPTTHYNNKRHIQSHSIPQQGRLRQYVLRQNQTHNNNNRRPSQITSKEGQDSSQERFFQRNIVPICILLTFSALLIAFLLWDIIQSNRSQSSSTTVSSTTKSENHEHSTDNPSPTVVPPETQGPKTI